MWWRRWLESRPWWRSADKGLREAAMERYRDELAGRVLPFPLDRRREGRQYRHTIEK